jgi:hypothetical protein
MPETLVVKMVRVPAFSGGVLVFSSDRLTSYVWPTSTVVGYVGPIAICTPANVCPTPIRKRHDMSVSTRIILRVVTFLFIVHSFLLS